MCCQSGALARARARATAELRSERRHDGESSGDPPLPPRLALSGFGTSPPNKHKFGGPRPDAVPVAISQVVRTGALSSTDPPSGPPAYLGGSLHGPRGPHAAASLATRSIYADFRRAPPLMLAEMGSSTVSATAGLNPTPTGADGGRSGGRDHHGKHGNFAERALQTL